MLLADDTPRKTENNITYDIEFLDGVFTHLAIVDNPRYERANIVFNSKTVVKNATEDAQGNLHSESTGQFVSKGSNSFFEKWNDAPVIELKPTSWEHITDIKELRKEAKKYFHSNLQGQNLTREGLKNIRISGKSFDEFFHISADPDKLKSVPQILELIEKGKLGEFEPDEKGRTDYIRGFHPIYVNLKTSLGVRKAELLVGEDKEGNLFYQMFLDYDREKARKKRNSADNQDRLSLNNIITDIQEDFNPDMKNKINNDKIISGLFEIISEFDKAAKKLNKNDYTILNGLSEILENYKVQNGWITLRDKIDDEGNPLRIYIPDYIPNGGAAIDFHHKINAEKNKSEIVYEFTQTRANISDEQKNHIKGTIDKALSAFKIEPPLRGVNVCTIGQGCLGVAITSKNTRTLSLDSRVFKEKGTEVFNQSVEAGWLARTDRDVLTSVLTHELGHTITATANNEAFWDKIKEIKSEYVKNIKENDTKNPDFVSNYARKSKDEFVAECFAQATLSKKPSRYAKMVLDEIKNHFKISAKEYKQLRLFNAIIGVLEMDIEHNIKNDKENDEIIWIEGEGAGYCLTEEEYEERKTEVEKHKKDELKK